MSRSSTQSLLTGNASVYYAILYPNVVVVVVVVV